MILEHVLMKRAVLSAAIIIAILLVPLTRLEVSAMKDNEKYLNEARAHVKEFEAELEPERLREAHMALEHVILTQETDPKTRGQLRTDSLSLWLHILQLLDRFLDPKFNPEDLPLTLVQPPLTSGDIVLRPGADSALIDDPKVRADYEKAIAANRAKAEYYRLQIGLRRLDERIPARAEAFIRNSYTSVSGDQKELQTAIDDTIKNPQRKAALLKLLTPSQP